MSCLKLKVIIKKVVPHPILKFLKYGSCGPIYKMPKWGVRKLNMIEFEKAHGYRFDSRHPVSFTEKIQVYKFYSGIDFASMTDKVRFKQFVTDKLGEGFVIPMFGAWDNIESLERVWDSLPEEFVLKANLYYGDGNIKFIHHRSSIFFCDIKEELASWLKKDNTLLNGVSRYIYNSKPMILAEQYMEDGVCDRLCDYKFFCFNGAPYCAYADVDHSITFYDMQWNKLDVSYGSYRADIVASCPKHFEQMKQLASLLSNGLPFVRVDFYDVGDRVYVGEMTFDPGGGFTPYHPHSFDIDMGNQFVLPSN